MDKTKTTAVCFPEVPLYKGNLSYTAAPIKEIESAFTQCYKSIFEYRDAIVIQPYMKNPVWGIEFYVCKKFHTAVISSDDFLDIKSKLMKHKPLNTNVTNVRKIICGDAKDTYIAEFVVTNQL